MPAAPTRPRQRPDRERQRRALARFAVYLACAAALGLLVASRSARVAAASRDIIALKEELRLVEAENKRLEMEALRLASLERIEREAEARLGMTRPEQVFPLPPPTPAATFAGTGTAVRAEPEHPPEGVHLGSAGGVRLNPQALAWLRSMVERLARALSGG